jgi:hypothetical protein
MKLEAIDDLSVHVPLSDSVEGIDVGLIDGKELGVVCGCELG